MKTNTLLLAGDIGGTKTTLALYTVNSRPGPPLREHTFSSRRTKGLNELITTFLEQGKERPTFGCFGVAGPIQNDRVQMTNLDWLIDARQLEQSCGLAKVFLINDLVATAVGALNLPAGELSTMNVGRPQPLGAIGVIAPGTGLGEAFILRAKEFYLTGASEGGHAGFAPRNHQQVALLDFLLQQEEHISVEKVCSGLGLPRLYDFLATQNHRPEDLHKKVAAASDRTPILVNAGLEALASGDTNHICVQTLQLFIDILAAEAANLALKVLATGAIYIGGGIPPRIRPFFKPKHFMDIFSHGVYHEMLADIPVHIILNPKTALIGAASYGMNQINTLMEDM